MCEGCHGCFGFGSGAHSTFPPPPPPLVRLEDDPVARLLRNRPGAAERASWSDAYDSNGGAADTCDVDACVDWGVGAGSWVREWLGCACVQHHTIPHHTFLFSLNPDGLGTSGGGVFTRGARSTSGADARPYYEDDGFDDDGPSAASQWFPPRMKVCLSFAFCLPLRLKLIGE